MATKLRLDPSPTFVATVEVPVPGEKAVPVKMTFKHMSRDQLESHMKSKESLTDADAILTVASGWDLEEEFNAENIDKALQSYHAFGRVVLSTYINELMQLRRGN